MVKLTSKPCLIFVASAVLNCRKEQFSTEIKNAMEPTRAAMLSKAALEMTLTVSFYQDGIARVSIDEIDGVEKRYKISDESDFAVMQD